MTKRFTLSRLLTMLGISLVFLLVSLLVSLALGVVPVNPLKALDPGTIDHAILIEARLSRVLLGAVVGAALASAGVVFQALLRNPLADPYVLGVSGGASLMATVAISFGVGYAPSLPLFSFLGALGAIALVYRVGSVRGVMVPHLALLAGVVFNAFASSAMVAIASLGRPGGIRDVFLWLVGSISSPRPGQLLVVSLLVAGGIGWLFLKASAMNALSVGDEGAHALGVDVSATRRQLFILASLLTGASVAVAGPIGFVGIVVPHALRLLIGPDHRLLLPASAIGGAAFLALCDTGARISFLWFQNEPPVGVITALIGSPFFLVLLVRRRGERLF